MFQDRIPQISLTDEERAKYDQSARIFLLETMAERSKFNPEHIDPKQWEYVRRRKSMSVYHSVNGTPDPAVLLMLGTGLIDGSIDDVFSGLYCDTTDDLRTAKVLLGYPLAGGAVMNFSERRSIKDPFRFAGIKWFAAKSVNFPGAASKARGTKGELVFRMQEGTTDTRTRKQETDDKIRRWGKGQFAP